MVQCNTSARSTLAVLYTDDFIINRWQKLFPLKLKWAVIQSVQNHVQEYHEECKENNWEAVCHQEKVHTSNTGPTGHSCAWWQFRPNFWYVLYLHEWIVICLSGNLNGMCYVASPCPLWGMTQVWWSIPIIWGSSTSKSEWTAEVFGSRLC